MEIKNKKAYFDYYIESELEAGIELMGTEIKSIRNGSAQIKDSYVIIKNNEAYILNMYIAKYEEGNIFNHDEVRTRRLLLHKKEIKKLKEAVSRDGYSIVPLKVYLKHGIAKVLIGVARGKKNYDKRETLKKKTEERLLFTAKNVKNS
jgi:SsrA-binding protein